jgi:hypothetical protein
MNFPINNTRWCFVSEDCKNFLIAPIMVARGSGAILLSFILKADQITELL